MSFSLEGPATSFVTAVLSYFSPSKSPFYSVVAFGTVSLLLTCQEIDKFSWWWVATPIFVVIALSAALSFRVRPHFEPGQGEEQLRFARSFCVSSALITFVFTAREAEENTYAFWVSYAACLLQIVVFMLYTWARSYTLEEQEEINFVQFALITATFLMAASYGNVRYVTVAVAAAAGKAPDPSLSRYLVVATFFYAMWFCLMVIWIRHLRSLITISIPHSTGEFVPRSSLPRGLAEAHTDVSRDARGTQGPG